MRDHTEATEEGFESLLDELVKLRAWMAAEARERHSRARSADPGVLSFEYLQCEIARLDRRIAQLEQAAEPVDASGLVDLEAA